MNYSDKLKDPRWQRKRLEILQRDNFTCWYCGDNKSTLHIHHETYFKNMEPWEIYDECLTTVCEDCHKFWHEEFTPLEKFLLSCLIARDEKESFTRTKSVVRNIKKNGWDG